MTALPDSLIKEGLFCCWRYEERNGRRTKVPYQPDTGQGAKSNDPRSFVSYETAIQASAMTVLVSEFSMASAPLIWTVV